MRDKKTICPLPALIAMILLAGPVMLAQEKQDSETKVAMKDLPAPVQQTVKEQSKGAVIRGLAKEIENGQTFYEVELRINGRNKDVLMDPNGKIVAVEEQVMLGSLPAAVKSELLKQAGKGRIILVESVTKDNALVAYEAHVNTAGRLSEIKIDPNGKPISN
jgi:uncharacterized membrane protein YkoI